MKTGVYKYLYLVEFYPVKTFGQGNTRVEVLEETPARYRVKFLDFHVDGRVNGFLKQEIERVVRTYQSKMYA
jgi:hypothetical protein